MVVKSGNQQNIPNSKWSFDEVDCGGAVVGEMGEDRTVGSKHETGHLKTWLRMVVKSRSQQRLQMLPWWCQQWRRDHGRNGENWGVGTQDWPSGNVIGNCG
jgi:hypothetical protein